MFRSRNYMNEIDNLKNEIEKLREENKKLKELLKENGYHYYDEELVLDKDDRLNIYMDYFKGRNDVYPYKYYSKKTEKYEYAAFDCFNKFKHICPITKGKRCSRTCSHYSPKPLTKDVVLSHMSQSQSAIGIYPLLENDTCYFLAMDFDGDLWFDNLLSVYRIAKRYNISCIMEKSQSGNGGHLWIFFETTIKASIARKLGDFLIQKAMSSNKHLSFNSFDRMFPNQDHISDKGFGNFIALPLQCDARKQGNSTFINEYGQQIKKSYHYLSSTPKVKENTVLNILKTNETDFKNYFEFDENLLLDKINIPLNITEDSMIHISKNNLDSKSIQIIRKLASTYNPEFYEKLRLHLSIYNTPRVLSEFIENDNSISIPRGLKDKLLSCTHSDLITYQNNLQSGNEITVSFKGFLRPEQQTAADSLMQHEVAILQADPGFGKTVTALYIMATLQTSTLIIVQNKELLQQWKGKIDEFIDYPIAKRKKDHYIGEYHGSKKKLKYNIDIALIQSLSNLEDYSILHKYGLVLIDECHHASSDTYRKVLRNIQSQYIYSFSATPKRKDKTEKITYMYLGDIVYKTNKKEQIENRTYEQILIPRITTFKCLDIDKSFTEICNELYINQKRNHLIIQDIQKEIKEQKNIIVLTDRKEHIQILYNQLNYEDYSVFTLSGDISIKERVSIREQLKNDKYIIIATSQLIGEGFDLPSLNTMFITMPISYEGRLSQYVGRLHREHYEKDLVKVYDYVDTNVKMLQSSFQKRLITYKKEGYKSIENNEVLHFNQTILNKANYEYFLQTYIQKTSKSIIIFAGECKLYRIQKLYPLLIETIASGIKIYTVINKEYDETIMSYLEGISTKILTTEEKLNGILIDEKEFWISNSSYFGVQYNDLYYLKTSDIDVIDEIKTSIKII